MRGVRAEGVVSADWDVAIVNGQPEVVLNREMVEALIASSPLGPVEARRQLVAAGYPFAACSICGTPLAASPGPLCDRCQGVAP